MTMTNDDPANPGHVDAYLEKLQSSTSSPCNTEKIQQFLTFLEQSHKDCVLLDLVSGDATTCIAAAKLGIARNAIAINARSSSKVLAQSEGVFGKSCEFYGVEDLLESPPSLILDNPHLLAEKMKSATVVLCCAPPVLLRRLVPLVAALINNHDDTIAVTLVHHFPQEQCVDGQVHRVPDTDLQVYHKIAYVEEVNKDETNEETKGVQVPMHEWVPPPPEPCDPDDFDKEFARGSIAYAMPTGTADKPFGSTLREY